MVGDDDAIAPYEALGVAVFERVAHQTVGLEKRAHDPVRRERPERAHHPGDGLGALAQARLPVGVLQRHLPHQLAAEHVLLREEELELEEIA